MVSLIKSVHSRYANIGILPPILVFVTLLSWFLFPIMVKQLNQTAFHTIFAICLVTVSVVVVIALSRNQLVLQPIQKVMLACWMGYLFALLLATLESTSTYALTQWCILFAKFTFFAFLLLYLDKRYIFATLRIYSNLMVVTVVFALITAIAVVLDVPPLSIVDLGGRWGEVYFGAYYVHGTAICAPFPVFRIQGLSEEPATYAFALLPAFFWLLIAEKAYVRSFAIVLGLTLSMSLGAGLFLLILLPVVAWKYRTEYKIPAYFLAAICLIGSTFMLSGHCMDRYLDNMDDFEVMKLALGGGVALESDATWGGNTTLRDAALASYQQKLAAAIAAYARKSKEERESDRLENIKAIRSSISTSARGKVTSFQDRSEGVRVSLNYLKDHKSGTGAALGMSTVNNSISVGYMVAVLEAGIVGGILYLCLFAIMGLLALKMIVTSNNESFDERVKVVVALSVCTVLVMGAQRIQPDLSLWHMWLYAMLFYLQQNNFRSDNRERPLKILTVDDACYPLNDCSVPFSKMGSQQKNDGRSKLT